MQITRRFLATSSVISGLLLHGVAEAQQTPHNIPVQNIVSTQKAPSLPAPKLDLTGYQDAQTGVIRLFLEPRYVTGSIRPHDGVRDNRIMGQDEDSYFVAQSFLALKKAGFDTSTSFNSWINWRLSHQGNTGDFPRFWQTPQTNNEWVYKQEADADDSTSALMMQLLYTMAPQSGLPENWQITFDRAEQLLDSLRQPNGLYIAKHSYPVSFVMDNSEIYGAFRALETEMRSRGQTDKANQYKQKAEDLKQSILTHLTNKNARGEIESFKVAAAPYDNDFSPNSFYPGKTAQLFPGMFGVEDPASTKKRYKKWVKENLAEWLAQPLELYQSVKGPHKTKIFGANDFPHLMIANYALDMGDKATARKVYNSFIKNDKLQTNNSHVAEYFIAQVIAYRLKLPAPRIKPLANTFQAPAIQNLQSSLQPN